MIVETRRARRKRYRRERAFKQEAKRKSGKPRVVYDADAGIGQIPPNLKNESYPQRGAGMPL